MNIELAELQSKLDEYLTPKDINFVRNNVRHSKYACNIAKAIVMLLGYPYPTPMQCIKVLERKTIIRDIKNLHKKRISECKKIQISEWMSTENETFDANRGYFGHKTLAVLKNWAIYVITHSSQEEMDQIKMENKKIQQEFEEDKRRSKSRSNSIDIFEGKRPTKISLHEIDELRTTEFNAHDGKSPNSAYSSKAISFLLDENEQQIMHKNNGKLRRFHFGENHSDIKKALSRLTRFSNDNDKKNKIKSKNNGSFGGFCKKVFAKMTCKDSKNDYKTMD